MNAVADLELGLTALSRGGEVGWFEGHVGGAYLAAYYMSRENDLPEHVLQGLAAKCGHLRSRHEDWFRPYPLEEPDPALLSRVVDGIRMNASRLSTSGHGVTLGVLALKALKERPQLVTPSVVNGICSLLEDAAHDTKLARYYGIEDYTSPERLPEPLPPYRSMEEMAGIVFDELHTVLPDGNWGGRHYFFAGEQEHGITFAHALIELERLGYGELAEIGLASHRLQMRLNRQRPAGLFETAVNEPAVTSLFDPVFWHKKHGDPHAVKVPYAAMSLLKLLPFGKRAAAERGCCKLLSLMS